MILDLDARRFSPGSRLGPLGTAQALQHAVQLEPEIIVKARGGVLLDHEEKPLRGAASSSSRLGVLSKSRLRR